MCPFLRRHNCLQSLAVKNTATKCLRSHVVCVVRCSVEFTTVSLTKMDEEMRKRLEYEEQFYGITSKFFVDSFKNFMNEEINCKINLLVDNFKNKIIDQAEDVGKFERGIQEMKKTLFAEYKNSIDETLRKREKEISDILSIPPNVLLKEDSPVLQGKNGDIDKIKEEIEELKGTFQSLIYLKQQFLEELQDADSAIIFMENFISDNNFDFNILPVGEMTKSIEDNRTFVNNP